jgi:hypothetical protein
MWESTPQSGLSTVVLDFTNELSPLLIGLIGLLWLSASAIAWLAFKNAHTQQTIAVEPPKPAPDHQEAA